MKITATLSGIVLASALVLMACDTPPAGEVNSAKAPDAAASASAEKSPAKTTSKADTRSAKRPASRVAKPAKAPVAEAVTPPTKIKNVQPVYPTLAQAARVEGSVLLEVKIDEHGKVADAKVLRSVPLLDDAALDAVRQWEYTPMRRGNVAVPTVMAVTVNFVRS